MTMNENLKEIDLDWHGNAEFAWQRDDPFHNDNDAYFDKKKHEILFIPHKDGVISENEKNELEELVENNPDRFLEIPPLTHGEHHDIFASFLSTVSNEITSSCNPESIGGFKDDLKFQHPEKFEDVWYGWLDYHKDKLKERAEKWFEEKGYKVNWDF